MTAGGPALLAELPPFAVARLPRIVFGAGRRAEIPSLAAAYGRRALLVTGARSLRASPAWAGITAGLDVAGIAWDHVAVEGEPSPELVDGAVASRRHDPPDVVIGIGGGSALDTAKAIAGLLRSGTAALDHLEGVGRGIPYPGPSTPFVAVPTTAGTGSEATKNAVLSGRAESDGRAAGVLQEVVPRRSARRRRGGGGPGPADRLPTGRHRGRRSGCPHPMPGGVRLDRCVGLHGRGRPQRAGRDRVGLASLACRERGPACPAAETAAARSAMAWGALASGIALANAGLGAVHGIVAALGVLHGVHHGTGCGLLLAETTRVNVAALRARDPDGPALARYAEIGRLLVGQPGSGP